MSRPLTKGELRSIEARIDEINEICDLCDPERDADVLANLDDELDHIIEMLERSARLVRRYEVGLKIVS